MNNRWRAQAENMYRVADSTMRKAIKEGSPSEFWAKMRAVHMMSEKAWAIRATKGYEGIERKVGRRYGR